MGLYTKTLKEQKYELTGIIMHLGFSDAGHYYSYIKVF